MIRIAIDGPGGAGKSSVAKAVARELGIIYVDTGALYRNIGLYMLDRGIDPKDEVKVTETLGEITLELKFEDGAQVILLNGVNRGDEIRTPAASMAASAVSAIGSVREFLLNMQRDTAKKSSVIMDGRDIGTVILPDAEVKIFLTASSEARAKRRYEELRAKGSDTTYEKVYEEMVERDKNDSTRALAPCVQAEDAVFLDNSKLTPEGTVKKVLAIVKRYEKKTRTGYMKLYAWVAPLFRIFMRLHPKGLENIPKDGGVILCPNHIHALDVVSVAAVSPRQITFIAKKELFSVPVLGRLITYLGAVKIDRGGMDVGAIRTSVEVAKSGSVVAIFPQGHRYPGVDPATTPIKNGAAMIAYHSGCDVVPVYIKSNKAKYALFRKIEVIFGTPIKNEAFGFKDGGRDEYERAGKMIFDEILALGSETSLPAYDPSKDKKRKKKGKR